jgi:hypothetical protein
MSNLITFILNNLIPLLFVLIAAIPGIYLAARNDFIIIKNKKYNNFFTRAMYTILPTTTFVLVLCIPISFFPDIFPETTNIIMNTFGSNVVLVIPAISGILFLLFVHKYLLRKDIPPEYWPDFEKYELYVYFPDIKIDAGGVYGTKFHTPTPKKGSKELKKSTQIGELIIDFKSMKGKDIAYGSYGEIVVSEKALNLFKSNKLTGFQEQAVRNWKDSKVKTGEKYFQLTSTHTMPPISAKTKLFSSSLGTYIVDHLVHYDKTVLPVSDFSHSLEIFGVYRLEYTFLQN